MSALAAGVSASFTAATPAPRTATRKRSAAHQILSADADAVGDFDHDGTDDILWRDADGIAAAWLMQNGQINATKGYGSTANLTPVASGDFNGDGFGGIMWQSKSDASVVIWSMTQGAQLLI